MSLRDALQTDSERHANGRVYRLLMDQYLDRMDAEDRQTALELLHDKRHSLRWLATFFTDNGYPIESGAVLKWRDRNVSDHG